MLAALESKLASLLGDGLSSRTHLSVQVAPGSATPPVAGRGLLLVGINKVLPEPSFQTGFVSLADSDTSRRVLPLYFSARLSFLQIAGGNSDTERADARTLMVDDVALAAHLLAADDVRSGKLLAGDATDPGYKVLSFALRRAEIDRDISSTGLTAELLYRGSTEIWPPGTEHAEGVIGSTDVLLVVQPIILSAPLHPVKSGDKVDIKLGPLSPGVAQIAVRVLSDAPLNLRGTIDNGVAGKENGVRILNTAADGTVIQYTAGRPPKETVEVSLASADEQRTVSLGTVAIIVGVKA